MSQELTYGTAVGAALIGVVLLMVTSWVDR
jgi:hypothetical protein